MSEMEKQIERQKVRMAEAFTDNVNMNLQMKRSVMKAEELQRA